MILDLHEKTAFADRQGLFAPRKCPACDVPYDSAIQPAVDQLQRAWQSLAKLEGDLIAFHADGEEGGVR